MELDTCASNPPLICRICGDIARGVNFEVITCMSCKAFFRRHALDKSKKLRCYLDGHCDITSQTRKCCSACRLEKCFTLGMDSRLIRRVPSTQSNTTHTPAKSARKSDKFCVPQPASLDLLQKDRSTLTTDEWNLLSNIVHAYDAESVIVKTTHVIEQQCSLLPKMRFKTSLTLDLIGSMYSAIQPFIERCPYFLSLPLDARRFLIQQNLTSIGSMNTALVARETNILADPAYRATCNVIYGNDLVENSNDAVTKLEKNTTLVKIMLIILAFSSNSSIVIFDPSRKITTKVTIGRILIRFQNIIVTMLWKYLVYQYGFIGAVHRLDCLVRNCLQIIKQMGENLSREHWNMVDGIVHKTERLLTING